MGEIWAAAIAGAAAVGSAYMSSRSASKGDKNQIAADKETARIQIEEGRKDIAYQDDLADWRGQQSKDRRLQARAKQFGLKRDSVMVGPKPEPPKMTPEPVKEDGKKKKDGFFKKASGFRKLKKLF